MILIFMLLQSQMWKSAEQYKAISHLITDEIINIAEKASESSSLLT